MKSDNKTTKTIFVGFLVVSFAVVAYLATGIFPLTHSAYAIDLDQVDLKCFGILNSCDNNIDNSVTDNSVTDNSVTDNSDNSDNSINVVITITAITAIP